jgi:hypothetical protein
MQNHINQRLRMTMGETSAGGPGRTDRRVDVEGRGEHAVMLIDRGVALGIRALVGVAAVLRVPHVDDRLDDGIPPRPPR